MIKVVVDTNVFLSAIFWKGNPEKVVKKCVRKEVMGITSPAILEELETKLRRKFAYPEEQTERYIELVITDFEVVMPKQKLSVVKDDPTDNKVIEAAVAANADYIVSGDRHLLGIGDYKGVKIVSPKEFVGLVR